MKRTFAKIVSVALLLIISALAVSGCSNTPPDEGGGCVLPTPEFSEDFYIISPDYSISTIKVINVYDEMYQKGSSEWYYYLMAECEILDNYEGPAKVGDHVNITIAFTPTEREPYYDFSVEERFEAVKTLLLEQDSFFGVFEIDKYFNHFSTDGKRFESDLYTCSSCYDLHRGYFIPINEGKLDFKPLTQYIKDYIHPGNDIELFNYNGYEEYFQDGMTKDKIGETARKIQEDLVRN